MAQGLAAWRQTLNWNRAFEWLVVIVVISTVIAVFVGHVREVQGQGEFAAIKTTVGALRTALVIDHLHKQARAGLAPRHQAPVNPFDLLHLKPVNYWGAVNPDRVATVPTGSWVYLAQCPCVGYKPMDDLWLGSPSGDPRVWYIITGMPGVLQLTPKERYHWGVDVLD
jgi:hypothetical protein